MCRPLPAVLRQYHLGWQMVFRPVWGLGQLLFRPRYQGLDLLPKEGPYILAGNHQSNFDVILVHAAMPQAVRWVAKAELFNTPLISHAARTLEAIPLDRSRADIAAVKSIRSSLKEGRVVGIFPQATRVKEKDLANKLPPDSVIRLLARSKVPILPFAIQVPLKPFRKTQVVFGRPFYLAPEAAKKPKEAKHYLMAKIFQLLDRPPDLPLEEWLAGGCDLELISENKRSTDIIDREKEGES
ncbi:MAG: lysophospholipid acyltransferase family protein [Eubacteriales bacterium]|nr:lysophospholipid acyltransferase family protein [Eubacteriales bacterium]